MKTRPASLDSRFIIIGSAFVYLSGCQLATDTLGHAQAADESSGTEAVQARQKITGGGMGRHDGNACLSRTVLLEEPWNVFNETLWKGDGDQEVSGGMFHGQPTASAASADYLAPAPVLIPAQGAVVFSNRVVLENADGTPNLETGAILMVNADGDGRFENYVFLNVGFTTSPNTVFVELFGADNGREFDQVVEVPLNDPGRPRVDVDLWVRPNLYQVGFGGVVVDSVRLAQPLTALNLFEVGVYGSRIDSTAITVVQPKAGHSHCPGPRVFSCKHDKRRLGKNGHLKNAQIRMARERIHHSPQPTQGLRCLAKLRETSSP